jgi:TRAP-type C4-dicarboxylate transport system substrate-binding protein
MFYLKLKFKGGYIMRRSLSILVLAVFGVVALSSIGLAEEIVLKGGNILAPSAAQARGLDKWAELAKERSNGELILQNFHSSELGTSMQQIENVMLGSQDYYLGIVEWYGRYEPEIKTVGIPYVFRDREHYLKYLLSPLFQEPIKRIEEKRGIVFVNKGWTWVRGSDRILLARRPIFSPADLKGIKMRMFQSDSAIASWKQLGANPIVIAFHEAYLALKQGTVDAITEVIDTAWDHKHTEILKYITITKEYFQSPCIIFNKKKWDTLSPEHQKILVETVDEAGKWYTDFSYNYMLERKRQAINEHGVAVLEVPLKPWQEKMKPFYAQYEKDAKIPAGYLEKVMAFE